MVTEERKWSLHQMLLRFKSTKRVMPAVAGQFFGKMGFVNCQRFGKYGRAKLRAFSRRQHEPGRYALNPQLESAARWCLSTMHNAPAREIPLNISHMDTIVSYSDGEGADAGVGVAIWSTRLPDMRPQAGFIEVPDCVRQLWQIQRTGPIDIMETEAVGPLLVLHNWPKIVSHCLWLHFVDNAGALAALINGSSSVMQADLLVGETWARVAHQRVLPWFDRVDSKANPVDGLSRKRFEGPWQLIEIAFPEKIMEELIAHLTM